MPAPSANLLQPVALAAFRDAELDGEAIGKLAEAASAATAETLARYVAAATVQPGITVAAPSPPGNGSTVAPGPLSPLPPNLRGSELERLAADALSRAGLRGEAAEPLSRVFAGTLSSALQVFTEQVTVAPGIAVAALLTTTPGKLIPGLLPPVTPVEIKALCIQQDLQGAQVDALCDALAAIVTGGLAALLVSTTVAPGIACSPVATVAPGVLL